MKINIPIPCFYGALDFCDAIRKVKSLGFDAVETYNWSKLNLDAVRNTCDDTGVRLLSMCTTNFQMTDPACRGAWLAGLAESCKAANRVGAAMLITQVGPDTGAPREEQHASIVAALTAAKPILEDSGVTIMVEPLNTLVDHKGYYLWSAVEGFDIVREVGHPLVKVIYDIYHQQIMEGNIIPNVTANLDCIAHLHSAGHPGRNDLQFGENDYKVIFNAIDAAGYTGYCGLEYKPLMEPDDSLREFKRLYL